MKSLRLPPLPGIAPTAIFALLTFLLFLIPGEAHAQGPVVTSPVFTSSSVDESGGMVTVTAQVDDSTASVDGVYAEIYINGSYNSQYFYLTNTSGDNYSGTYALNANLSGAPETISAQVQAYDSTFTYGALVPATGSVVQPNDVFPGIVSSTLTPANMPFTGGTLTISASVTQGSTPLSDVEATIYDNGSLYDFVDLSVVSSSVQNSVTTYQYQGTLDIQGNNTIGPETFTAEVLADDTAGGAVNADVAGTCVQPNDSEPVITDASMGPATLTRDGGLLNVTATITNAQSAISSAYAQFYGTASGTNLSHIYLGFTTLSNGGSGNVYTGTFTAPPNSTSSILSVNGQVFATDVNGNTAYANAAGTTTQDADTLPVITNATVATTSIPASGAPITVSANITDADSAISMVNATMFLSGQGQGFLVSIPLNLVSGSLYSGTFTPPVNTTGATVSFSATITATDADNASTTVSATGAATQASDTPPVITSAAISPASIPKGGGLITVTASAAAQGTAIDTVTATVDGFEITLTATGTPGQYSGTYSASVNSSGADMIHTAIVTATDTSGGATNLVAQGDTIQPSDASIVIANASISPATISSGGGAVTVTATVTDADSPITSVSANLFINNTFLVFYGLNQVGSTSTYSGTYAIPANTSGESQTITASVYAFSVDNSTNLVEATGETVQASATAVVAPTVTQATISPGTLPSTGGTITVSAQVDDPSGTITTVTADVFDATGNYGFAGTNIVLSNGGSGDIYTGTFTATGDYLTMPFTYSALVTATDIGGGSTTQLATGSTVQSDDLTLAVTNATMTPSTLPNTGGTITFTATVTDATSGVNGVFAHIYNSGVGASQSFYNFVSMDNGGSGDVYTGTLDVPGNRFGPAENFTATIAAGNFAGYSIDVPVTGSTTIAADPGPTITSPQLTPSSLPYSGGVVTVSATIDSTSVGLEFTYGQIYKNGTYVGTAILSNGGSGDHYTGTSNVFAVGNTTGATYTAIVIAEDLDGVITQVLASGITSQAGTGVAPPAITPGTLSPTTLTNAGGPITISATIVPGSIGLSRAVADVFENGNEAGFNVAMSNGGSGNVYTATFNAPGNPTPIATSFTAVISATDTGNVTTSALELGNAVEAPDSNPPSITNAQLSPGALPASGGTITISAAVAPGGSAIKTVNAIVYNNGQNEQTVAMTLDTSLGQYVATFNAPGNSEGVTNLYTALITATDVSSAAATVAVAGSTSVSNDTGPTISASISPDTLDAVGGPITVTATITDAVSPISTAQSKLFIDGSTIPSTTITLSNGGSGSTYTGQFNIGGNTTGSSETFTASVTAEDQASASNTVAATGSTVQTADSPPTISASMSPATLPVTGGVITVTATADDAVSGINTVTSELLLNGSNSQNITLTNTSGDQYSGTFTVPSNTSGSTQTYTATATATDNAGAFTAVVATGQTTVPAAVKPVIANATITPATIAIIGGTITVSATVTDAASSLASVTASILTNGAAPQQITLTNGGSGSSYSGTLTAGANTAGSTITFTATVTAVDAATESTTVSATGSTTQATATAPSVTGATISPSVLSPAGGTMTVQATVTDTTTLTTVTAKILANGANPQVITLSLTGTPNVYSGTLTAAANTSGSTITFTASVTAVDAATESTTVTATGSSSQSPAGAPSVSSATIAPSSLTPAGGTITVQATVTDTNTLTSITAKVLTNGTNPQQITLTLTATPNVYSGTLAVSANMSGATITYTATVTAVDAATESTTVTATGSTTQASATPPSIPSATISPSTLPVSGGTITVQATVTDTTTLTSVTANVLTNGANPQPITLTLTATPNVYSGTFSAPSNTGSTSITYTANVTAMDTLGLHATVTATGSTVETSDTPPSITNATIQPSSIPVLGGTITISATATATGAPIQSVTAELMLNGANFQSVPMTLNAGTYTVTVSVGPNTTASTADYTATVTASDTLSHSSTVTATGSTSQPADIPPSVTNVATAPSTLTPQGGTITISATVTDASSGVSDVSGEVLQNGLPYSPVVMTNGGSGNVYTGTFIAQQNTGATPIDYTATVTGVDNIGAVTSVTSSTPTVEAGDSAPAISAITLSPSNLPNSGGTITVTANITDASSGVSTASVELLLGGANSQNVAMTNTGGSSYQATFSVGVNNSSTSLTYTASVTATDGVGNTSAVTGAQTTVQAGDGGPVFTVTSLSPATLAASGGPITINATVTDAAGTITTVTSQILLNGVSINHTVTLTGTGTPGQYTGSYTVPANNTPFQETFSATISATDSASLTTTGPVSGTCVVATLAGTAGELPNLETTQIAVVNSALEGQDITVAWTVTNVGLGSTSNPWNDDVYLSQTPTLTPGAMLLGKYAAPASLGPGAGYTQSEQIALPPTTVGNCYIIVVADGDNLVQESDESDNTATSAIDITRIENLIASPSNLSTSLIVGEPQNGTITLTNAAAYTLTGIHANVSGLPSNMTASATVPVSIAPGDSFTSTVTVNASDDSTQTATPIVHFSDDQGDSADSALSLTVVPPYAQLTSNPATITTGMVRGTMSNVSIIITNTGGATALNLTVTLPPSSEAPWLSLASPATIGNLAPGASATITLLLSPAASLPLGIYSGGIGVNGTSVGTVIDFAINNVSDAKGTLKVTSSDEYTYFAGTHPPLTGATVTLTDPATGTVVLTGTTDFTGTFASNPINEGAYQLAVSSPNHANYTSTVLIAAGEETDIAAFLSLQLVTYQFTVLPVPSTDTYEIALQAIFQTNVPAPEVTVSPATLNLQTLSFDATGKSVVYLTYTNHGLIAADNLTIQLPSRSDYIITAPQTSLGTLPAETSVVVPVTFIQAGSAAALALLSNQARLNPAVTLKPLDGGANCGFMIPTTFTYPCGGATIGKGLGVNVQTGEGCPAAGEIGNPPPTTGGGVPFIFSGPSVTLPNICDPCIGGLLLAVTECALNFVPFKCPTSLLINSIECSLNFKPGASVSAAIVACIGGSFITSIQPCASFVTAAATGPFAPITWLGINVLSCSVDLVGALDTCVNGSKGKSVIALAKSMANVKALAKLSPADVSTGDSMLDSLVSQLTTENNRALAFAGPYIVLFGDEKWFESAKSDLPNENAFLQAFANDIGTSGNSITPTELTSLEAMPLPAQIATSDVVTLVQRWDNSVTYYNEGVYTASQVPSGGSTNFVNVTAYQNAITAAQAAITADAADGYVYPYQGIQIAEQNIQQYILNPDNTQSGTCAKVKIQLDQTVSLTRTNFHATLNLSNAPQNVPLSNVQVTLNVTDASGTDKTSLFAISTPTDSVFGGGGVDGTGTLGVGQTGTANWTIEPTEQAGANGTTIYYVGGTITYTQNGVQISIPLFPTGITVVPDPSLQFHYFLQHNVYSQNPFDLAQGIIDPVEPFYLGLLVNNVGKGTAHQLTVTSSQPQIVDNEKGLAIAFDIIGTQVNLQPVNPSLTVNLGDIAPENTSTATFDMTSTLSGEFTSFSATFKHVDDIGNTDTSLIDSVDTHSLNHVVRILSPSDDGKPDFLTEENANPNDLPDTVWNSVDGSQNAVTPVTTATASGLVTNGNLSITVTLPTPLPTGFTYIQLNDPGQGNYALQSVTRGDGSQVLLGPNAWTTKRELDPLVGSPFLQTLVYIFDSNPTATYTLNYASVAPVLTSLSPASVQAGSPAFTLTVTGTGFLNGSMVLFTGAAVPTQYVSGTKLLATVPAANVAAIGPIPVSVSNPSQGSPTSGTVNLNVTTAPNMPVVTLTAPAAGTVISAPTSIALTATANETGGTIASVAFDNNGAWLATGTPSGTPGTFSTTIPSSVGIYNLTAVATDTTGQSVTSAAVQVTSNAGGTAPPPLITLLSPAAATAGSPGFTLTVTGTGFTPDSVVQWAGQPLPTTYVGATTLTVDVPQTLVQQAGSANVTVLNPDITADTSPPALFTINPLVLIAPTVSINTPIGGASFTAGANITITATASANTTGATIDTVDFYSGPNLIGSATDSPYTITFATVPAGDYSITAIATDTEFDQATSLPVAFTVTPGPAPMPTFLPTGGTLPVGQTVSILDSVDGASIYYTLNGTQPDTGSTPYNGAITISGTQTINAIATAAGFTSSPVASATFTETLPTPTFTPASGTLALGQTVSITDSVGANIYYTTDGNQPDAGSTPYIGAITVTGTQTIKAIAIATGYANSAVATATFTETLPTPTFTPASGTLTLGQTVRIGDSVGGAKIYYTTNGTSPGSGSTLYGGPITVTGTETIQAIAIATGYANSAVATTSFTATLPTPTFTPTSGTLTAGQKVTIGDSVGTAAIYYTTNGTTPGTGSTPYLSQIVVTGTETINAIAIAAGYANSAVASSTFTSGGSGGPTTPTPAIVPAGGSVSPGHSVTITDSASTAAIYYTVDGMPPSTSSTRYNGAFTVTVSETVTAIAIAPGSAVSAAATATLTVVEPTPTFYPAITRNVPPGQQVTLTDSDASASIYYTVNGTAPDAGSTPYSSTSPIIVSASETIKAIAIRAGCTNSTVASATFTAVVPTPTFYPRITRLVPPGQQVTISDTDPGAAIYFTTNGTTPGAASTPYTGAITVSVSETINAIAIHPGCTDSAVASAIFTAVVPTPAFYPRTTRLVPPGQQVTLTDADAGAAIYFTTDGTPPGAGSTLYGGPITLSANETISAIAIVAGCTNSGVASATFTVVEPTPTFVPAYTRVVSPGQKVTLSDSDSRAAIYFTTNGDPPSSTSTLYNGPIILSASETISAVAIYTGCANSAVASATFTVVTPAPVISPNGGTFSVSQTVKMTDSLAGAAIYYTTNGTAPNLGSTPYTAPFVITTGETVEAIAVGSGDSQSAVVTAVFAGITPTPSIVPNGGMVPPGTKVTITDYLNTAVIHYTTDGTTPSTGSPVYTGSFTVSVTETIKAIATVSGNATSGVSTSIITVVTPTPTISPAGGPVSSSQTVSLKASAPTAVIYYTTNGTVPTVKSPVYSTPFTITNGETVKAIAILPGCLPSAVATATFTVTAVALPAVDRLEGRRRVVAMDA